MTNKKMQIYSFLSDKDMKLTKKLESEWEKYFNIEHKILPISKISSLKKFDIDILFISNTFFKNVSNELIHEIKKKNNHFYFIVITNDNDKKMIHYFKNYADHIIDRNSDSETIKWKTISILRRYWNTYSKPTTLMYKNIIADFVENKVSVDGKEVYLTLKELKLLWNFMNNVGTYIPKDILFKNVWGIEDHDSTRVLNQMIFKLKNKISKDYFQTARSKGIKFE